MTKDDALQKIKKLQEAYKSFEKKMKKLEKEQMQLIKQTLRVLDEQKAARIRSKAVKKK